jgi:hypothetical protein
MSNKAAGIGLILSSPNDHTVTFSLLPTLPVDFAADATLELCASTSLME